MIDAALRKIEFYVPESHLEKVKSAIFQAGAGRVGQYDNCAWQTLGQGQYRPLKDSDPFVGEKGVIEIVEEYKVEVVCKLEYLFAVIEAMKVSHPYDEVAYSVVKLEIGL